MPPDLAASAALPRLLGLSRHSYRERLPDPATSVELVEASGADVGQLVRAMYVFCHRHRTIASVNRAIRVAGWLAPLRRPRHGWRAAEIARRVSAVERSVGFSDCYPRALLTAWLCLTAGLDCEVTIGILAPTSKMHAWCSTGGAIPYEPVPEHWFYSPLVIFDVSRRRRRATA